MLCGMRMLALLLMGCASGGTDGDDGNSAAGCIGVLSQEEYRACGGGGDDPDQCEYTTVEDPDGHGPSCNLGGQMTYCYHGDPMQWTYCECEQRDGNQSWECTEVACTYISELQISDSPCDSYLD